MGDSMITSDGVECSVAIRITSLNRPQRFLLDERKQVWNRRWPLRWIPIQPPEAPQRAAGLRSCPLNIRVEVDRVPCVLEKILLGANPIGNRNKAGQHHERSVAKALSRGNRTASNDAGGTC